VDKYLPPNKRPTVHVSNPENRSTVKGTVGIKGSGSDEDGDPKTVELSLDGGVWVVVGEDDGSAITLNWSHELDTTELEDGEHGLRVRCHDGEEYSKTWHHTIIVENEKKDGDDSPGFQILGLLGVLAVAGILMKKEKPKLIKQKILLRIPFVTKCKGTRTKWVSKW